MYMNARHFFERLRGSIISDIRSVIYIELFLTIKPHVRARTARGLLGHFNSSVAVKHFLAELNK